MGQRERGNRAQKTLMASKDFIKEIFTMGLSE
jgi:hypothetical protein